MGEYTIKPLSPGTWDDFARLAERHNGCWSAIHGSCWANGGGCWCMRFQRSCAERLPREGNRARKERLVSEGRAHAALVFDGDTAVPEAYPQDTAGQQASPSVLYSGTRDLFERAGFRYDRPKGRYHCVLTMTVPPVR